MGERLAVQIDCYLTVRVILQENDIRDKLLESSGSGSDPKGGNWLRSDDNDNECSVIVIVGIGIFAIPTAISAFRICQRDRKEPGVLLLPSERRVHKDSKSIST
jgi:hypothetical protein